MKPRWTASAERDLVRLHAFLVTINAHAAAQVVRQLVAGAEQLMQYPQLGVRLEEFLPRDVRRIIMGDYEMRYELTMKSSIFCGSGMAGRIGNSHLGVQFPDARI